MNQTGNIKADVFPEFRVEQPAFNKEIFHLNFLYGTIQKPRGTEFWDFGHLAELPLPSTWFMDELYARHWKRIVGIVNK